VPALPKNGDMKIVTLDKDLNFRRYTYFHTLLGALCDL
jgi:hypothetical protein